MNRNLNRRKLNFFSKKVLTYFLLLCIFIASASFTYSNKNYFLNTFINSISIISEKFDYEFSNLVVSGSTKDRHNYLEKKINKYLKTSIFLLPFEKISEEIKEDNWIKKVKLSTNYKNTLFVELEEYKAIGIYNYNDNFFYFDEYGKIIDELNNIKNMSNEFIIFSGQSSNLEAKLILDMLDHINFREKFKIKNIEFIKKRRWNITLNNNIKLMLSEYEPMQSIQNFINIQKNLSKIEMNNIKYLDLRNINKTLINYN